MSGRFLLAFVGFVVLVGGGGLWLALNIMKKRALLRNLLSLSKERRFFWYRLRQAGYRVTAHDLTRSFEISVNLELKTFAFKADFLAIKNHIRYACVFAPVKNDKENLKLFFLLTEVFHCNGVIFYNENERAMSVWE